MHMTERGVAYPLWEAIEAERVARGWTKTELAERLGMNRSRSTIDRLATGRRPPLPKTVRKIADVLGMDRTQAAMLAGLLPARYYHSELGEITHEEDVKLWRAAIFDEEEKVAAIRKARAKRAAQEPGTDQRAAG